MTKSNFTFKLVKAILNSCDSESELRGFLKIIDDNKGRYKLTGLIRGILDTPDTREKLPATDIPRKTSLKRRDLGKNELHFLTEKLKKKGFNSPLIHNIIKRKFHADIPVNKVGLQKYLRRLSKQPYFADLINLLLRSESNSFPKAKEDPWLREMIIEHKKKLSRGKL